MHKALTKNVPSEPEQAARGDLRSVLVLVEDARVGTKEATQVGAHRRCVRPGQDGPPGSLLISDRRVAPIERPRRAYYFAVY